MANKMLMNNKPNTFFIIHDLMTVQTKDSEACNSSQHFLMVPPITKQHSTRINECDLFRT